MQEYKRIAYRTQTDIQKAEKLHAKGWIIISVDQTHILLERKKDDGHSQR